MTDPQPNTKTAAETSEPIVNDFSMTFSTRNGSGSATSNVTLLRALFKMGIPVSGKNIFPSNIQGQPTWYTIRVSKDGYTARAEEHEIVVAMNPVTIEEDINDVVTGGALFYADHIKLPIERDDITKYPVPAKSLAKESGAPAKLRDYVANMAYVGVLAQILGIDLEKIRDAIDFHFAGKEAPISLNMSVIEKAIKWAKENLTKQDPYSVEPLDLTSDCILMEGNTAAALGAIYGGCQFVSWYPITPASSMPESAIKYFPKLRTDPETGKATYAIVQSEDELAAAGMAIGAGWAGLRSMTSTSGPGLALMTEFISLAYYTEVPVVIWNVQRVGPSTGLPTRTAQGDITMHYFLGHGDTNHVLLFPGTGTEIFEFGWKAQDIAERLQGPVFPIIDLDMGMNNWMTTKFEYPDTPIDRGKIIWEEDMDLEKFKEWGRYLDIDGDGIPYRTVLGNRHPRAPYFLRGTGHDENAIYSEDSETWERVLARIKSKYETIKEYLPDAVIKNRNGGSKIGVIGYGSTTPAIEEAFDRLYKKGLPVDFCRIRSLPFKDHVREFIETHDRVYLVEMNRDGQMWQIIRMHYPELAHKLFSLPKHDGMQLSAVWVEKAVLAEEK